MLDYLATKLNAEQLAAATHISTSSLILAGAGSGKTRVLTYKIAYLIFGHHISVSRILAVTFTNKAANEMKERLIHLSQEWNEEIKSKGETCTPLSAHDFRRIGTFHAVFLKILKEDIDQTDFGYSKSFVVYDTDEAMSVIRNIMKDDKAEKTITPKEVK
ncbi:UvrD-helicase domain-containing protein [Patescibacteria group bacterium]|nr:UvrD-helicase domain-containing protein [Patescibacteria group bacterium]